MPKMKTRKAVAKRFKVTGTGKLLMHKPGRGHLLSNKSAKRIRNGRKATTLSKGFSKSVRALLGI